MQKDVHKTVYLFCTTKKLLTLYYGKSHKNALLRQQCHVYYEIYTIGQTLHRLRRIPQASIDYYNNLRIQVSSIGLDL